MKGERHQRGADDDDSRTGQRRERKRQGGMHVLPHSLAQVAVSGRPPRAIQVEPDLLDLCGHQRNPQILLLLEALPPAAVGFGDTRVAHRATALMTRMTTPLTNS